MFFCSFSLVFSRVLSPVVRCAPDLPEQHDAVLELGSLWPAHTLGDVCVRGEESDAAVELLRPRPAKSVEAAALFLPGRQDGFVVEIS